MSKFNYALDLQEYTLSNALFWGNCVGHYQKAKESTKWGPYIVHIIITTLEYLPVISQIASVIEMIVVRAFSNRREPILNPQETSMSSKTVTPENSPKNLTSSTDINPGEVISQVEGQPHQENSSNKTTGSITLKPSGKDSLPGSFIITPGEQVTEENK